LLRSFTFRDSMKRTACLYLLFPLLLLSCSMNLPSQRNVIEFPRADGPPLKCYEPPPDVIVKGATAHVELATTKLIPVLNGKAGVGLDVERIRQELPSEVAVFQTLNFELCLQHGNGILSKEGYQAYTARIIPAYNKNPPVKIVAATGLVETCGPSFTTQRPAHKFVSYWASQVEALRNNRNAQYQDLQNLLQVRGRTPVDQGSIDPFEEIFFTLDCLERIGYLKVEKFDPPRNLVGFYSLVENRKILFSDPTVPVPR
jgi:hypothetical protein